MLGRSSGTLHIRKAETKLARSIAAVRKKVSEQHIEPIIITPELAMQLLEHNAKNRPLAQQHVQRLARQIIDGKWRFNGDTIKIATTGDVLDGQHRLWACIEAKMPIESIIVYGILPEAFSTIDTLRKPRNGSDVLALAGASYYRPAIAQALMWLIRWERGCLIDFRAPVNRIENSDIEEAYIAHPGMANAVEAAIKLRSIAPAALLGFLFYIFSSRDPAIADRMMSVLEEPAAVSVSDPFFRLRAYFTSAHHRKKEPLMTIALAIKAANAAKERKKLTALSWRVQGASPEPFPELLI